MRRIMMQMRSILLLFYLTFFTHAFVRYNHKPLHSHSNRKGILRFNIPNIRKTMALRYSNEEEEEEETERLKKRMEVIRKLQDTYYKSDDEYVSGSNIQNSALFKNETVMRRRNMCEFNETSGEMYNVPLWRVGWTELPGRTNVLSVHDAAYTHMFERLIRSHDLNRECDSDLELKRDSGNCGGGGCNGTDRDPIYFGHLFVPPSDAKYDPPLLSWEEEGIVRQKLVDFSGSSASRAVIDGFHTSRPAVIGTLMRIADYRRRVDGKFLILVQALERFVVTNVRQSKPYGVVDVQLLPDLEEDELRDKWCNARRAFAVKTSMLWQDYECDVEMSLPVDKKKEIVVADDVYGPDLFKVMPYANLGDSKYMPMTSKGSEEDEFTDASAKADISRKEKESVELLEENLTSQHIMLRYNKTQILNENLSSDVLENGLWIKIDEYFKATRRAIPNQLLSLLPTDAKAFEFQKSFTLYSRRDALRATGMIDIPSVDDSFPKRRRQRRLCYFATKVIEGDVRSEENLRQKVLEIQACLLG
eukprot:CAMPEP_0116055836 /NCGR_PEP_ID=MMETSP0322-20121206/3648_1 /TAXON_ID=163516 /ORGANISM="Leptocylindrus danicus var. apora, Strain B651" /LENGTH=531 /DNA_ID=CAMNT_0003539523 /DNA_START=170 /DNA_END=1766 /DNA_ORIENTATION=+